MSEETVVGKRHTIVVPKAIRKKVNLEEGQKILLRVEEGRIIVEPLPTNPYKVLEEVIRESYEEKADEAKAEEWLRKRASR